MNYALHILVYFEIYAIFALSLNLVVGYCGLFTLSHAGYFAIGAYTYAILSVSKGFAFLPATLAGCLIAGIGSLAVSLFAWRFRGDTFVVATLAVQAVIFSTLNNWFSVSDPVGSFSNLTNGPYGISAIPHTRVWGYSTDSAIAMLVIGGVLLCVCLFCFQRLLASPWGRLVRAMRDDELAARSLGKNTRLVKVQAIGIACVTAAIAGSLYAAHVRYIDPSLASFNENILVLAMLVVGGTGNLRGPLVGAALLTCMPEVLRLIAFPDALSANIRLLVYGLTLSILMHTRPQGVAGEYRLQ